jgi:hypothetical protein
MFPPDDEMTPVSKYNASVSICHVKVITSGVIFGILHPYEIRNEIKLFFEK